MDQDNLPAPTGWFSVELPGYRPGQGTYDFSAYESIPPLPAELFTGKLEWLTRLQAEIDDSEEEPETDEDLQATRTKMSRLMAQAETLGLTLPEAFLRLMGSPALQHRIPSCTACEFQEVETIVPHPRIDNAYLIRFLNDQQDVLLWYLYLTPGGDHCVLVSPLFLEELDTPGYVKHPEKWDRQAVARNTLVCAPSFEEFIYRFWMENVLWFKLNSSTDLADFTPDEQRYLAHYKQEA